MQKEAKSRKREIKVVEKGLDEKKADSWGCCTTGIFPLR